MRHNIKKIRRYLLLASMVFLCGCNSQTIHPTLDPLIIDTIAAKTVLAQLAATDLAASPTATQPYPTATMTPIPTLSLTPAPYQTPSPQPTLILSPDTTPIVNYASDGSATQSSTNVNAVQPAGDFGMPLDHDPANGATIQKNQPFTMTWTFKNVGTTTWNKNYYITFFGGTRIGKGDNIAFLVNDLKPGEVGSISVSMVGPARTGTYQSIWMLMSDQKKAIMELNVFINVP